MSKDTTITKNLCNEPISKCGILTEVSGDIDSLVTYLGITKAHIKKTYDKDMIHEIEYIQKRLFNLGAECNCNLSEVKKLEDRILDICVIILKNKTTNIISQIELPTNFVLPGNNELSANLDMCRVLCRKLERSIINLYNSSFINNKAILEWVNKLSYYLYLLARKSESNKYNYVKG